MLVGTKVRLRPKRAEDALNDYQWRRDPELAELDASVPLDESFEDYQRGYLWELEHPGRHRRRFAIETLEGRHIGNIAYFDVNETTAEAQLGIMIGDRDYWAKGYGTEAIGLALDNVLSERNVESVYLRTLDWNKRAQTSFANCGFVPVGRLVEGPYDFILMRVTKQQWEGIRKRRETLVGRPLAGERNQEQRV